MLLISLELIKSHAEVNVELWKKNLFGWRFNWLKIIHGENASVLLFFLKNGMANKFRFLG